MLLTASCSEKWSPARLCARTPDISDMSLEYTRASSFADDTRIVALENSNISQNIIQAELSLMYDWARINMMTFNETKFEHLQYRVHQQLLHDHLYYTEDGCDIKKVSELKDLGIIMDSDGSFNSHIQTMITKARRQTGWILRTFKVRDRVSMLTLFKAMVLPILEYCCQLWNPTKVGQVRDIEGVQRSFTSRIVSVTHLDYWDRLKELELYSLERRRERYLILYVYKIMLELVPNFSDERYRIKTKYSERRGLSCVLPSIKTSATSRVRSMVERSFAVRAPELFNSLPKNIRNGNLSFNSFKNQLDKILSKVKDEPSLPNLRPRATSNSLIDQFELMKRDRSYYCL